jgi:hypothetical protein
LISTSVNVEMLGLYQARKYTITFDYGREFAEHEQVAEAYFEHPHASWERWANKNTTACCASISLKTVIFRKPPTIAWLKYMHN